MINITNKDIALQKKLRKMLISSYRNMEKELWGTLSAAFTFKKDTDDD